MQNANKNETVIHKAHGIAGKEEERVENEEEGKKRVSRKKRENMTAVFEVHTHTHTHAHFSLARLAKNSINTKRKS